MVATKKKPNSAISEIKTLRAKLAHLEKKYTQVALEKNFLDRAMKDLNFHDNAHDGVVYTDAADNIVYANPYFLGMMGVKDKTEILDQPFPDYMWNNAREADRLFNDIKSDGFVREREMALYNREGQPVFAMCSGVVSKDKDGNILGTEIMFCNITSKRSFQAELVEQHALLDTVLQSTPDPILVLNSALDIKRSNPAAQKLLDLTGNSEDSNLITVLAKTGLPKDMRVPDWVSAWVKINAASVQEAVGRKRVKGRTGTHRLTQGMIKLAVLEGMERNPFYINEKDIPLMLVLIRNPNKMEDWFDKNGLPKAEFLNLVFDSLWWDSKGTKDVALSEATLKQIVRHWRAKDWENLDWTNGAFREQRGLFSQDQWAVVEKAFDLRATKKTDTS